MLLSFFRWNKFFNLIGKENDPNFVIIINGGKSQYCRKLRDEFALKLINRSKIGRRTNIYQKHNRKFSFFFKNFDERLPSTGCYIPINIPDIIPVLITSHFTKRHTSTLKGTLIFSGENMLAQSLGFNLNFPNFF